MIKSKESVRENVKGNKCVQLELFSQNTRENLFNNLHDNNQQSIHKDNQNNHRRYTTEIDPIDSNIW